jgi:hypothetical protein
MGRRLLDPPPPSSARTVECSPSRVDVVTLFTAGEVNRRWKGLDWSRRAVLRYYRVRAAADGKAPAI